MRWAARGAAALGLLALGGCSSPGELVIAVHTDLSLPEDIDVIKIEVWRGKEPKFFDDLAQLGLEDADALLPFTLGVVAEEAGVEVTVRASGWSTSDLQDGQLEVKPRILREAVTMIPQERVALLHLPLHFLCDGSARGTTTGPFGELMAENELCDAGETCVAGECVAAAVDSASLPDYAPEDVFGGRSGLGGSDCFNVVSCFEHATEVALESDCSFKAKDAVNVALETSPQTSVRGLCGGDGRCFVALDAGSEAGFRQQDGVVKLPPEVCQQKAAGKVLRAVSTPVGEECPRQKVQSLPTCGPWSAVGGG
ncbi:hypothetical protein [Sorangium sp. So ce1182]|uniref:hypothetical protein n=1 Tax=Sorangium sp. So ce1182 TaxID=3133334 RepID=UPI003F614E5E